MVDREGWSLIQDGSEVTGEETFGRLQEMFVPAFVQLKRTLEQHHPQAVFICEACA